MVWCLALVLSAASANPQAAVLVTRRTGLSPAEVDALSGSISKTLASQGVPLKLDAEAARAAVSRLGLKDAAACEGRKRCITELAAQLGTPWVISLSLAKLGADLSIGLELIRDSTGAVVEKDSLVLPSGATPTAEQLDAFSRKLRDVLGTVQADAPLVTAPPVESPKLTPDLPVTPPVMLVEPVAPRGHGVSVGLGVGAAASLVAGVAVLIAGVAQHEDVRPTLVDGELRSKYSAAQAVARSNEADAQVGVGIGLGVLGLALGTGAVLAW